MKKTRLDRLNSSTDFKENRRDERREERIVSGLEIHSCSFILEEDVSLIDEKHRYDLDSGYALTAINELDPFLKYGLLDEKEHFYLIIHNIDLYSVDEQVAFLGLAKDRGGYYLINDSTAAFYIPKLPDDVKIVFTISRIDGIKKVLSQLWNLGSHLMG